MKRIVAVVAIFFCVFCGDLSFAATDDSAKDEIEKIKKTLDFEVDEVEGITWINDKNIAKSKYWSDKIWGGKIFYIYLGQKRLNLAQKEALTWIRWRIGFRKSDWVFFDVVIFNVDGERVELNPERTLRDAEGGNIVEIADIIGDDHLALLKKIADSKKTIIRFKGRDYSHDFVVSNEQKTVLKRLLRYYELVSK